MPRAEIRSIPDDDLQYRCQEIRVGGKTLHTPTKTVDPKKCHPLAQISKKAEFVNEMYARLSEKALDRGINGGDQTVSYRLSATKSRFRNPHQRLQLCFMEFDTDEMPSHKEIEFATDHAYVNSDITPLPMVSDFRDRLTNLSSNQNTRTPSERKFERFQEYLTDAIDTINQLNNKPIMGYVPDYRLYFGKFVKLYADKGINTFYFDAHLSTPITLQASLRAFLRELNNHQILEKSMIHMINPGMGRGAKGRSSFPARDVLGFGLGIDSLGERHMSQPLHPKVLEEMQKNPDSRQKLFNKATYAYVRPSSPADMRSFYPADSEIDMSRFLGTPDYELQNSFNSEQISLECTHLRGRLTGSDPMLDYLNHKQEVTDGDVKILKQAKIHMAK